MPDLTPAPDLSTDAVCARLDLIKDPCSVAAGTPMGLAEMGLVAGVDISADGHVRVDLRLTSPFCHMIAFMQAEATTQIGALPGVTSVSVHGDQGLDWSPEMISTDAQARRRLRLDVVSPAGVSPVTVSAVTAR